MQERSPEEPELPFDASDVRPFALAHLSDLHATPVRLRSPLELANKRALGWLSWWRKRRKEHLPQVLEALLEDLRAARTDHVGVTGDLTHLGLESEIAEATAWLERIGPPSRVSVVPGNHDAYAGGAGAERWWPWAPYMMSSAGSAVMSSAGSAVMSSAGSAVMSSAGFAVRSAGIAIGPASDASSSDKAEAAATAGFPYVRRLGRIALIGVSSARPTAPFLATGRLGAAQRARLEELLAELGEAGLCRVLLMHHPPLPAGQSRRRQLEDAAELQALLARSGAELVLHGHTHRSHFATLPGPRQPIPVVGVPSSSAIGRRAGRRARYHIYRIVPRGGASASAGFALSFCARAFDPLRGCFVAEEERSL